MIDLLHPTLIGIGGDTGSVVPMSVDSTEDQVFSPSIVEMMDGADDLEWVFDIACRFLSLDEFFTKPGSAIAPDVLKICQGCKVRTNCAEHAYTRKIDFGYFGGLSPAFRRDNSLSEAKVFIKTDKVTDPD